MLCLNKEHNNADKVCEKYEEACLSEHTGDLIGVIMGVAYGGDVERLATEWKDRGHVYGYDTFEGHPKFLVKSPEDFEATCMNYWYEQYGKEKLTKEYQEAELKKEGITNATLIKGLVSQDSCTDLPYITYAFLDMDIYESMKVGYEAVKNKIVKGGYLILHDINNIPRLIEWYKEIKKDPQWEVVEEFKSLTGVLRKKHDNNPTPNQELPGTTDHI